MLLTALEIQIACCLDDCRLLGLYLKTRHPNPADLLNTRHTDEHLPNP